MRKTSSESAFAKSPLGRGFTKLGRVYSLSSVTLVSTILLFVALAIGASVTRKIAVWYFPQVPSAKMKTHAELVGLNLKELRILTKETWNRSWEYAPWVGFKERPRQGNYVNVSKEGFRKTLGSSESARFRIFMLGGSASFGYNVTDQQTISSFLQKKINKIYGSDVFQVRNYGRAYYFSSQEYILLWQLLKQGTVPDMVIFLDYLNEGRSKDPFYSKELGILYENAQKDMRQQAIEQLRFVVGYAVHNLPFSSKLFSSEASPPHEWLHHEKTFQQYAFNNKNIRTLCAQYDIIPFFFIGPIPGFRNSYETHVFMDEPISENMRLTMEKLSSFAKEDSSITDLSGMLKNYKVQPFVDNVHYTPRVSEMMAEQIFKNISKALSSIYESKK